MAKNDFGGKIECRLSGGTLLALRGTLTISPSGRSNEAMTNQDGSVDRVMTPTPRRAEFTFADRGADLDQLMKADRFDVTYIERDTGVSHYFTSAFVTGEPSVNRINGEVTGLTLVAETYNRKG